ncbi:helix-turn-helix domain-containing protein [Miniphocaeibacter massiliensis]|uniref:helix-turn-helix domain-containing protein n=1 Tax=Miniphocaeibacter massiliensis TaxID=2041841 RepID=UPI0013EA4FE5|nr:AraC family transcriptional regulator [Miniphocaeibacter massiliensis]
MYYPIQIPYILDNNFLNNINYREEVISELSNFVICYWQMLPFSNKKTNITNIIITDGCIDLVVDFENKIVGFSGMSKTDFSYTINLPNKFMGLRLYPGVFFKLTGISPSFVMDKFISISEIYNDFKIELFFSLSFNESKEYLCKFIKSKINKNDDFKYINLINNLSQNPPDSVKELCNLLNISQSKCQRKFIQHYGLTPKSVLSILRFQKCLKLLIAKKYNANEILEQVKYYDQSHFINDFKYNIGITPFELIKKYQND